MPDLHPAQLRALAVTGAIVRLAQIHQERAELHQAFPELMSPARLTQRMEDGPISFEPPPPPRRGRRRVSRVERRAISERMKKYWAARRTHAR